TEEESFIFLDRATNSAAELIALEEGFILRESWASIEFGIAQQLHGSTVIFVAARFDNSIDYGAAAATKFCRCYACDHTELLQRLDGREEGHSVHDRFIVIDTVE